MQEGSLLTFDSRPYTPMVHPWEIVLAFLVFSGLICFAIWRARRRSELA